MPITLNLRNNGLELRAKCCVGRSLSQHISNMRRSHDTPLTSPSNPMPPRPDGFRSGFTLPKPCQVWTRVIRSKQQLAVQTQDLTKSYVLCCRSSFTGATQERRPSASGGGLAPLEPLAAAAPAPEPSQTGISPTSPFGNFSLQSQNSSESMDSQV